MPTQSSFNIKQNTPEADKLERRLHDQLKEIWDPAADATVARYLTAMLAKGYDRKKIHAQLKAILQEDITIQLLDWYVPRWMSQFRAMRLVLHSMRKDLISRSRRLYKHLRLHGHEYQSKQAPARSASATMIVTQSWRRGDPLRYALAVF
jgi:hypothetical protein